MKHHLAWVILALVTAAPGEWSIASASPPELILYNGKIVTVDEDFSYAEAVAISGGKFVAVAANEEIRSLAGPETRTIDLRGRTVVPGFMDNHMHSAGGGPGVDLSRTRSLDEVLAAIAARVAQSAPGEIVTTNRDWHEAQLEEQRLPLRRDLDKVAPDNPVVVARGGHEYILNSAALQKWGIDENTPTPEGGRISRYDDGTLNGELVDEAQELVQLPATQLSMDERIRNEVADHDKLHAAGLTSIRNPGGSSGSIEQYRLIEEIKKRGLLTMRVSQLMSVPKTGKPAEIRSIIDGWNLEPDDGDEWLRVCGIKLGVDGGFEGGWMREPYAEPYDREGTFFGLQIVPAHQYTAVVKLLNNLGWRVWTHAVGDAAIDQVLDAYAEANEEKSIVGQRWGIEHAFIGWPDHFPRIKELGLGLSVQNHLYLAAPSLIRYWGPERAARTTPVRDYLDAGLQVSGGTDSDVIPYPPLWVIYHFVTRDTITAGVMGADQRITREEALRLVTANNAWLTFEEDTKGSIEPGKLADLVVLEEDIMSVEAERIRDMDVLMTMVGGKIVFEHAAFRGTSMPE
jgi:predicted amidohydrolase YtcJ